MRPPDAEHVIPELSAWLDGDLDPRAAERVAAHVESCAGCRAEADLLRAVIAGARGLERPEPPVTLWPAIEGRLAREERAVVRWRQVLFGAFAGAACAAVVALALGAVGGRVSGRDTAVAPVTSDPALAEAQAEFENAARAYERAIDKLRGLLDREQARWSEDARARCAERLARLDETIARSREALRRMPSDGAGRELFAAYSQKIALLTEAVHRGGPAETGGAGR